jgi:hypothetical protein
MKSRSMIMRAIRLITAGALLLTASVSLITAQTVEVARTSQLPTHWVAAKRHMMAVTYNENNRTTVNMSSTAIAPSSMIVSENTLRRGTEGMITTSKIEYSGDPGTFYALFLPFSPTSKADYSTPLAILGARRSVEIAERAGAKQYAEPELREAADKLATLEQVWPRSRNPSDLRDSAKKNNGLAHDVMRLGEQARSLSVERSAQAKLAAERQQAGDDVTQAQTQLEEQYMPRRKS